MPPTQFAPGAPPLSGRYLSVAEREALALLRAQRHGVRECARQLKRSPSTISRELRRNAATRSGALDYRATTAQWHADRAACCPKAAKLALSPRLRQYVQGRLAGVIVTPVGRPVHGPTVAWTGRKRGRTTTPSVGSFVESDADLATPHARLSRRPDHAHQP